MKDTLRAVLPRAAAGAALMGLTLWSTWRHHWLHDAALDWTPLLQSIWALGVLTLVHCAWWLVRRKAPTKLPALPGWVELVAMVLFGGMAYVAMADWAAVANPDHHLTGNDYDTYALNTIAVESGDWRLFIPDKHVFHARVVAALWDGGPGLSTVLVQVSVLASALLPLAAWLMARRGAGAFAGLMAAILTLSYPLLYRFATQTTAYPLFYLLVGLAAAAVIAALQRPTVLSAGLAGLVAGAAAATQEKTMIVLLPIVGVAGVLALPGWLHGLRPGDAPPTARAPASASPDRARAPAARSTRRRLLGRAFARGALRAAVGVGLFVAVIEASVPPRGYTPLVSLVTNQRQEVHVSLPYTWRRVKRPDTGDPAGVRKWLPRTLWDGEIESWIASVRTPPDSNALSLTRSGEGRPVVWKEIAGTTIPPLQVRVRANLLTLPSVVGPLPWPGLWLVVTGSALLLLFGRGRSRVAAALGFGFLSALAPLTLRFGDHYVLHVLPFAAALAVAGYDRFVGWLVPGRASLLGRVVLMYLFGAYALGCWTDDPDAWRAPRVPFPPPSAHPKEDPGGYASNLEGLTAWLDTQDAAQPLADCLPGGLLMVRPQDARFAHGDAQRACAATLGAPPPGVWLLASSHGEFRKDGSPTPQALLQSGRWRLVWGYDTAKGVITDGRFLLPPSAVLVLEAVDGGGEAAALPGEAAPSAGGAAAP